MKLRLVVTAIIVAIVASVGLAGPASAADPVRPKCKILVVITDKNCVAAFDWYDTVRKYPMTTSKSTLAKGAVMAYGPYIGKHQLNIDTEINLYGNKSTFRTCVRTELVKFAYKVAGAKKDIADLKKLFTALSKVSSGATKNIVAAYMKLAKTALAAVEDVGLKAAAKSSAAQVVTCSG